MFVDSFRKGQTWGLDNYIATFTNPVFRVALLRTVKVGAIVTVLALLLSYPASIALVRSQRKSFYMSLIIFPLMINAVARTYAWLVIMGRYGLVNRLLASLGLSPLQILYTEPAIVIGLLQLFLPFSILSIVSALENMPPDVEEAARSLGANGWRAFLHVVFPLTREGMIFGGSIVFTGCITAYVTPAMLGGPRVLTLSTLLYSRVMTLFRWEEGTVIAMVMLVLVFFVHRTLRGRARAGVTV